MIIIILLKNYIEELINIQKVIFSPARNKKITKLFSMSLMAMNKKKSSGATSNGIISLKKTYFNIIVCHMLTIFEYALIILKVLW